MATLSRKILQMMAAVLSAMGSAHATLPHAELPPLAKLIGQLREDAGLRARFSLNPRSVFQERGIDPTPYDLPDRLDGNDVERFLSNWTGARGPAAGWRTADTVTPVTEDQSGSADAPRDEVKVPHPVVPVYGAPPGSRAEQLPEPVVPLTPAPKPWERRAPNRAQRPPHRSSSFGPVHTPVYGPPPGYRTKP